MFINSIKFITLLLAMFFTQTVIAQHVIDNTLKRYRNNSDAIHYNLKGDIGKLFKDQDLKLLKSNIEVLDVIAFNDGKNMADKDLKRINASIDKEGWEILMDVKEKSQKIKMYSIGNDDILEKVFVMLQSKEMNTFLLFRGKIYFEELSKLNFGQIISGVSGG